jgi:2-polyprenyl-6-methoxyphenol hydroxylase-like FAD-dependent oxidoreductase
VKPGRTVIVGGGVGGMALAAALTRLGLPFVLLERAGALGEVGSGLGVLPGAVRALQTLGVGDELFARGAPFRRFVVCSSHGDELAEVSFTRIFEQAGRPGYVLHRGALHAALTARVKSDAIRTGAEIVAVEDGQGEVRVVLRDGSETVAGDLVVGADGLHSVVRRHVLGDGPPRYAGETIFRGIADFALDRPETFREVFGAGRRAAYYDLGQGRTYWWATSPVAAGTDVPASERRSHLQEAFAGWAFDVPEIIARTPEHAILRTTSTTAGRRAAGIADAPSWSATRRTRRRRTSARARAWRSRTPSSWRARSWKPGRARRPSCASTRAARGEPRRSCACPAGGAGSGSGSIR